MKLKTIGILLILTILTISLGTVAAENQTDISVNGTDTVSIQNAINTAKDGDTVNLGETKNIQLTRLYQLTKTSTLLHAMSS